MYNSHSCNKEFKSIITANGFKQLINEPTRVTDTTSTNRPSFHQLSGKHYTNTCHRKFTE